MNIDLLKSDLERITGQRSMQADETMADILSRLDTMAESSLVHERLKHYLSKRSYVKALAWLEDPAMPHQL